MTNSRLISALIESDNEAADDLLLEAVALLKNNATVRSEYQKILKHVLVDEYQDTNIIQHELLKYLTLSEKIP